MQALILLEINLISIDRNKFDEALEVVDLSVKLSSRQSSWILYDPHNSTEI